MPSVYFTGASSQGKTTTAKLLSQELFWPISDGIARSSVYSQGTVENQEWLSRQIYHNCMSRQNKIFCRTPLCVAGYSHAYNIHCPIDEQHIEMFARSNPIVIYFPMILPLVDDNFRPVNVELNEAVDQTIKTKLDEYNMSFYTLGPGSPEERVQEIMSYLKGYEL